MRFFEVTALLPRLLELSRNVWRTGFLWQLGTYPFAESAFLGAGAVSTTAGPGGGSNP